MNISDEVRAAASDWCSAMADWWSGRPSTIRRIAPVERERDVHLLSEAVMWAVYDDAFWVNVAEGYRRAEALLRDGWCPGDPVYRRKVSP